MLTSAVFTILGGTASSASAAYFNPVEPRPVCGELMLAPEACVFPGAILIQPEKITFQEVHPTAVTIKWGPPPNAIEGVPFGYWVEAGTGPCGHLRCTGAVSLQGKAPDVTEATITGLEPNTEYWVSVEPAVPEPEYEPIPAVARVATPLAAATPLSVLHAKHHLKHG
jgi:hypothetical protein